MTKRDTCRCCFLSAFLIFTFVGAAVVIVTVRTMKQKHANNMQTDGHTSRLTGFTDDGDDLDLRINTEGNLCKKPSCITCKAEVLPNFEPTTCDTTQRNIRNGSCFLCQQKCWTFHDLLANKGERLRCPRRVKINCCILSTMGNLIDYCGPEVKYNCYRRVVHKKYIQSVHEPICKCPAESQAPHCPKTPYTETARCRCFKSNRKLCGQEDITQCENINKKWTQCQMNTVKSEERYNCLCSKSKDETDGQLSGCSDPDTSVHNT